MSVIGVEKPGILRTMREPAPGNNPQEDRKATLDNEEVLPVVQMGVFDLEDAVGCRDCQWFTDPCLRVR